MQIRNITTFSLENKINCKTPVFKNNGAIDCEKFPQVQFKGSIKQVNQDSFNVSTDKKKTKSPPKISKIKKIITSFNNGLSFYDILDSSRLNDVQYKKFEKLINKGVETSYAKKIIDLEDDKYLKFVHLMDKNVRLEFAIEAIYFEDVQYERFVSLIDKRVGMYFALQAAQLNDKQYEKFLIYFSKGLKSDVALNAARNGEAAFNKFDELTKIGIPDEMATALAREFQDDYSMLSFNEKLERLKIINRIIRIYSSPEQRSEIHKLLLPEIKKIENSINQEITKTDVSQADITKMMKGFFANNNEKLENIISTTDFSKYGRNGVPLKYPRKEFLNDLSKELINLPKETQTEILNKLEIDAIKDEKGYITGYNGIIALTNLSEEGEEGKVLELANKFIKENSVKTGNSELDNALNSLIQGMPEFVNVIGKQQHGRHNLSVDAHIFSVLKNVISDPNYKELSNSEKFCLKFATVLHDIAKSEGILDEGHAAISALYTRDILKKINLPIEVKNRIYEMVENHHWLKEYNTGENTAEQTAVLFRRTGDLEAARILANADLKGVSEEIYELFKSALEPSKQNPITEALYKINSTGQMFLTNSIINKSKVPNVEYNGKTYKVVNLSTLSPDTDLSQYGFEPNTTVDNLRLFVHTVNESNILTNLENVLMLSDSSNDGFLCASFISLKDKNSYYDNKFGVAIKSENANIANASSYNQSSGGEKTFGDFANIIMGIDPVSIHRNKIADEIVKKLNLSGYFASDSEYSQLFSAIQKYTHASQLDNIPSITINDKTYTGKEIKEAIIAANDSILGNDSHNEVNVYTPQVNAVIAKVNSIEEVPQELLDFAEKQDLPILLLGA